MLQLSCKKVALFIMVLLTGLPWYFWGLSFLQVYRFYFVVYGFLQVVCGGILVCNLIHQLRSWHNGDRRTSTSVVLVLILGCFVLTLVMSTPRWYVMGVGHSLKFRMDIPAVETWLNQQEVPDSGKVFMGKSQSHENVRAVKPDSIDIEQIKDGKVLCLKWYSDDIQLYIGTADSQYINEIEKEEELLIKQIAKRAYVAVDLE